MRTSTFLITAALVATLALPAAAKERKLSRAQVPSPVLTAFEKAYPKAKALSFAEEDKDGKACYEIESHDGPTRRDLLYAADGTILEIEETVPPAELPAAVRDAVAKQAPKATIKRAEKVTRGDTVRFEIELGTKATTKTKELVFDVNGTPVEK
jgi:hypothetical protein